MQLQNTFFNLSKKPAQIESKIDNKSTNSFNSEISSKNINKNSNKNKEEKEEKEKNNVNKNLETKENNNNIKFNENEGMEKLFIQNSDNKIFSSINKDFSQPNINKKLDDNFLDFNPNNQKNNNNIDNINDENFFNFSFYNSNNNNKNNYKNINNNFYKNNNKNKINNFENNNNEINNNLNIKLNDEEPKINQNNNQNNNNNQKSPKHFDILNKSNIKKFDQSEIRKERSTFFSIENSDSNFRKKKHNNQLKVRYGDWICPNCENLNFAFRNNCNRCGLSKENTAQNNNNLQIHENNLNNQRPILFNNININYIFNSIFPINNINIINNPIIMNYTNINNYYGNYNNYHIYNPCNVNIK